MRGALTGMAVASALTNASRKRAVNSFIRITSRQAELVLTRPRYSTEVVRDTLSMMFVRYQRTTRAGAATVTPAPPQPPPPLLLSPEVSLSGGRTRARGLGLDFIDRTCGNLGPDEIAIPATRSYPTEEPARGKTAIRRATNLVVVLGAIVSAPVRTGQARTFCCGAQFCNDCNA